MKIVTVSMIYINSIEYGVVKKNGKQEQEMSISGSYTIIKTNLNE